MPGKLMNAGLLSGAEWTPRTALAHLRSRHRRIPGLECHAMRLSPDACEVIVRTTVELAGPDARVLLFGSRLHDHLKGGDIDLLG